MLIVEDNDSIPENNNEHNKDENDNKENNQSSNDSSDGSGEEIGGKPKLYGSILKHPGKVIKSFVNILSRKKLCFYKISLHILLFVKQVRTRGMIKHVEFLDKLVDQEDFAQELHTRDF